MKIPLNLNTIYDYIVVICEKDTELVPPNRFMLPPAKLEVRHYMQCMKGMRFNGKRPELIIVDAEQFRSRIFTPITLDRMRFENWYYADVLPIGALILHLPAERR